MDGVSDAAYSAVREYLSRGDDLQKRLSAVERDFAGLNFDTDGDYPYRSVADRHGLSMELLRAATAVRRELCSGIDDLVHAAVLAQALPLILDAGEAVDGQPRLACIRDPRRPFDLENDERVVIANVTDWSAANTVRRRQLQRELFWDFMYLALDGRDATLVVLGREPERFLSTDTHEMAWVFDGAPRNLLRDFDYRRLPRTFTVREIYSMYLHVDLLDLETGQHAAD
uniref:hypothetical protein n=1 Tax=Mycolicibacterium sp. CBMA 213 TaxID=1968788 RepID=UPI00155D9340|nr:hypothetical protein [Mycolicibacterium sp. CBMA 213]